jgi:hypothetical protein
LNFSFLFSVLALLALDSLLDKFNTAMFASLARNSIDFLVESPFQVWSLFSLSSFSLAIFFNFQHAFVLWVVGLAVGAILRPALRKGFLATFHGTFLRFCKLAFFVAFAVIVALVMFSCSGGFVPLNVFTLTDKPRLIITCGKVFPQIKGFSPMGWHSKFQDAN